MGKETLIKALSVDPIHPQPEVISRAVDVITAGGVVMFPTYALYGLGADATNPKAVGKVFDIKQRPANNPLLILVDSLQGIRPLVTGIPVCAEVLIKNIWPGGVTLIFEARPTVLPELTGGTGKVGIRMPEHPVARALCQAMGRPITATSANRSGFPAYDRVENLDPDLARELDLILDAGKLAGGVGSTVVDVTVDPPKILREGRVSAEIIQKMVGGKIPS